MFVIGPHRERHIQVREYRQGAIWFRRHGGTLDVLVCSESNIDRGVAWSSEQLRSWVLVEHSFTECSQFLPLEAAVLVCRVRCHSKPGDEISIRTMNCLFRRATGKFP